MYDQNKGEESFNLFGETALSGSHRDVIVFPGCRYVPANGENKASDVSDTSSVRDFHTWPTSKRTSFTLLSTFVLLVCIWA